MPLDDPTGVQLYERGPARRAFAAGDVVRLLVGVGLVAGGVLLANLAQSTIEGIEADLVDALARFPDGIEELVLHAAQLLTSVVPLVALVVLLARRRWQVALLLILTGFVATVAMHLADTLMMDRDLATLLERLGADASVTSGTYPDSRVLASTTAIVTVAAPWLSRGWKRALWGAVAALARAPDGRGGRARLRPRGRRRRGHRGRFPGAAPLRLAEQRASPGRAAGRAARGGVRPATHRPPRGGGRRQRVPALHRRTASATGCRCGRPTSATPTCSTVCTGASASVSRRSARPTARSSGASSTKRSCSAWRPGRACERRTLSASAPPTAGPPSSS